MTNFKIIHELHRLNGKAFESVEKDSRSTEIPPKINAFFLENCHPSLAQIAEDTGLRVSNMKTTAMIKLYGEELLDVQSLAYHGW